MRKIIPALALLAAVATLVVGWIAYHALSAAGHAEHALHAQLVTFPALKAYVVLHDGAWPRSWADLEQIPSESPSMYQWPRDSAEVQKYVAIDFSADPDRLLKHGPSGFDAVRPIGPSYPIDRYRLVEGLLDAIRDTRGQVEPRETP